jgi:hypothetical protein
MDKAWQVAHRDEQGTIKMSYVVWVSDDLAFELYP